MCTGERVFSTLGTNQNQQPRQGHRRNLLADKFRSLYHHLQMNAKLREGSFPNLLDIAGIMIWVIIISLLITVTMITIIRGNWEKITMWIFKRIHLKKVGCWEFKTVFRNNLPAISVITCLGLAGNHFDTVVEGPQQMINFPANWIFYSTWKLTAHAALLLWRKVTCCSPGWKEHAKTEFLNSWFQFLFLLCLQQCQQCNEKIFDKVQFLELARKPFSRMPTARFQKWTSFNKVGRLGHGWGWRGPTSEQIWIGSQWSHGIPCEQTDTTENFTFSQLR